MVLLEDVAALAGLVFALVGVGLAVITGDGVWDGIGTIAIGVLLVVVAIVLGVETKSLLVGEGAAPADVDKIRAAVEAGPDVERIIHMKTLYLGPDELLVGDEGRRARRRPPRSTSPPPSTRSRRGSARPCRPPG